MYHEVITVVLHNVNTRASDTPQIRRDTTVIHVFRELSHELCRYISDTSTIRPIHSQYVIDTRIAVGRCRYSSIHGRYAADTQPIRRRYAGCTLSLALCPKLKEPVLLLVTRVWGRKLTEDHDGDCVLTLGRPTHELLAEEGGEQVEEEEDEGEGEGEGEGPTAEQTAVMEKAFKAAMAGQEEEEEQEGRPKRARKPKPQPEVPAKSSKKKGSPKKKGK